jgi:putative glycerol-1-phosphate prenyltransferase
MVSKSIDVPLIIGGGIRTPEDAKRIAQVGADLIVVGNKFEEDYNLISEMAEAIHSI